MHEARRIPKEFRYWERRDDPAAHRLRLGSRVAFGLRRELDDEQIRAWAESYFDADPVAEAFVDELAADGRGGSARALVEAALERGVDRVDDAPASLKRWFADVETLPSFHDAERVELGQRVFRRWGKHLYSFAGLITLHGYRESSVAKPLAFTGAYNGASANRRFLETAAFWHDVAAPGSLGHGGRGRATALRVRLMHVSVRRRLMAHPGWRLDDWGVPISQGDALLTLMGGSVVPGFGLRLLGYRTTRDEIDATLHFWRYVGHLLGVSPRFFPASVDEALALMLASEIKAAHTAGADGRELCHSYFASYAPRPEDRGLARVERAFEHARELGYSAWFVPRATRRAFGFPPALPWALWPLVESPFNFARESLRRVSPRFEQHLDERTHRDARAWIDARLGERGAEYHARESFTR